MGYQKLGLKNGDVVDEKAFQHIDNSFVNIHDAHGDYSIHISFDDTVACLTNLTNNTYNSLFDEPFFGWLKGLHDMYGAKFSIYVYNLTTLASVPTKYKSEFFSARHWLKFGLHAKTPGANYASATYADAKTDWNSLASGVIKMTGTHQSIDRVPRLHNFSGSLEAITGMRDAACGALGFLAADDSRVSYHLTDAQDAILKAQFQYLDQENGLIILKTNYRGEWLNSAEGMYETMEGFLSNSSYVNCFKPFVWFTHEPYVYSTSDGLKDKAKIVEDVCKFAYDYNIPFTYPQNELNIKPSWFMSMSAESV